MVNRTLSATLQNSAQCDNLLERLQLFQKLESCKISLELASFRSYIALENLLKVRIVVRVTICLHPISSVYFVKPCCPQSNQAYSCLRIDHYRLSIVGLSRNCWIQRRPSCCLDADANKRMPHLIYKLIQRRFNVVGVRGKLGSPFSEAGLRIDRPWVHNRTTREEIYLQVARYFASIINCRLFKALYNMRLFWMQRGGFLHEKLCFQRTKTNFKLGRHGLCQNLTQCSLSTVLQCLKCRVQ